MDPTTDAPLPPSPPPPPPPPTGGDTLERVTQRLRTLRRSRSERVLAGVCGGVARSLGLDPVLVRVVVAVLAFVGGAGLLLYVVGWLLLPEDTGRASVADRALGRRPDGGNHRPVGLAVALVVGVLVAASLVFDRWDGVLLLALAVVGLVLWIDRRPERMATTGAPGPLPTPGAPGYGTATYAAPAYAAPAYAATASAYGPSTDGPPTTGPTPGASDPTAVLDPASPLDPTAPHDGGPPQPPTAWSPSPPPPPAPPRARSMLFAGTMSCLLIALGTLGAVDAGGGDVSGGAYPALALGVVGAGLVLGAWVGRSRGLVVVGLQLSVATQGALAADRVDQFRNHSVT